MHTHDSCINEISNCDLFVLIIGGRFGGNYKSDPEKSIVNAEYIAARELDLPVFTFIKRDVYEDHKVYTKNKHSKIADKIIYPSIEKQEHAIKIFNFIDEVRHSSVNNGIFHFEFSKDIESILGKQWAGMFCDFLTKRKYQKQFEMTTNLLNQLSIASQKTEEIIKSMYLHIDQKNAVELIKEVDREAEAKKFFEKLIRRLKLKNLNFKDIVKSYTFNDSITWLDYVSNIKGLKVEYDEEVTLYKGGIAIQDLLWNSSIGTGIGVGGESLEEDELKEINDFESKFHCFKELSEEQRKKVIKSILL